VLIRGVFGRSGSKASIVDRLHAIWPNLSAAELLDRMQEVARDGLPQWLRNEFWPEQVDRILLTGLERANRFRREAIAKALKACPALQVGAEPATVLADSTAPAAGPVLADSLSADDGVPTTR